MEKMKKGFTLIEMLVVIGIIAVLIGSSIGGYSAMTKYAERSKCNELVKQVATALAVLYQKEGSWPKRLASQGKTDGKLDADTAVALKDYYSLNVDSNGKLAGRDKFGIVSPWAADVLKRSGSAATISQSVNSGGTIDDHILHFAVDLDGDGIIEGVTVGGESVDVRATAVVWCAGRDGRMEAYSIGKRSDDVYSWTPGQAQQVK